MTSFWRSTGRTRKQVLSNPYALQRTRPSRSGCTGRHRGPGSLSLGRYTEQVGPREKRVVAALL